MAIPDRPVPVNTTELHYTILDDVNTNSARITELEKRLDELEKDKKPKK